MNQLKLVCALFICLFVVTIAHAGSPTGVKPLLTGNDMSGVTVAGEEWRIYFDLGSDVDGLAPTFQDGDLVFQASLPTSGLEVLGVSEFAVPSCANTTESFERAIDNVLENSLDCGVAGDTLSCVAVGTYQTCARVSVMVRAQAGEYQIPPQGGECLGDPNDSVPNEWNENNNDCSVTPDAVVVRERPQTFASDWLQVSMWDSFTRVFDLDTLDYSAMQPALRDDGQQVYVLNDIVRHPQTGNDYVFYRAFGELNFRLGLLEAQSGVTDIGSTGEFFHDSAFTSDGTLYAVAWNGKLHRIGLDTGTTTALCQTGYSAADVQHSALAFDPVNNRLLQLTNHKMVVQDTANFPNTSDEACNVIEEIPIGRSDAGLVRQKYMHYKVFMAEYSEGLIYASDSFGQFFAILPEGGAVYLGQLPNRIHGMVRDPGGFSTPNQLDCAAPFYTVLSQKDPSLPGQKVALLGVYPDSGTSTVELISMLPFTSVFSLDLDPTSFDLYGTALGNEDETEYLFSADPCTGEIKSKVEASISGINALDIRPDGTAYGHKDKPAGSAGLYTVDLETGVFTLVPPDPEVPGVPTNSTAMAVFENAPPLVALAINESLLIQNSDPYGVDSLQSDFTYPPELSSPVDGYRAVDSLDVTPDDILGRTFDGLLLRNESPPKGAEAPIERSKCREDCRPNALVTIGVFGDVSYISDLPTGISSLTGSYNELIFRDGFEAQGAPK